MNKRVWCVQSINPQCKMSGKISLLINLESSIAKLALKQKSAEKMKRNKKISSTFDKCNVTASQDIYLQRCGYAVPGQPPPDSDPSVGISPPLVNDGGIATHRASDESESDSVIGSGYDAVESQAIRFVSPLESADAVDSEEDAADPTVEVVAEKQSDAPLESKVDESSSSGNRRDERLESPAKEDGGKKLKIHLRDVVKAIVMNSRNTEEGDDKDIEKTSCVQILLQKGFQF